MGRITELVIKAVMRTPAWIFAAISAAVWAYIIIDAFIYKLH